MTQWASGFTDPVEMVFDDAGYAYVVDYTASHIVKVTPNGLTKTTFATIANASSITRDAAGNFYVGEYFNQKIDKITPGGVVSTYVPSIGPSGARLTMVSMDTDGTLYAGLLSPGTIYKIGPGGSPVTVFNNSMPSCLGFEKDKYGYWYSASYDGCQIFRIRGSDGVGGAIAGASGVPGHVDGTLAASRFNYPCRPTIHDNVLYIPEYNPDDVRVIYLEPASPTVSRTWGAVQALYR
jgi:hypothetical protein